MTTKLRYLMVGTLVVLLASAAAIVRPEHPSHAERPNAGVKVSTNTNDSPVVSTAGLPAATDVQVAQVIADFSDYLHALTVASVVEYLHAVDQANLQRYLQAVAEAAAATAQRPGATVQNQTAHMSGSVGDCTGFSVPDWIIQRESGGNPNAVNPSSGAYGCSQTLPSHYRAGGACAGLDMYSVDGQRQCTWILSDGGRNMQPWAL